MAEVPQLEQLEQEWATLQSAGPAVPRRLQRALGCDPEDVDDNDDTSVKTIGGPWDPRTDAELDSLVELYGRYRGAALHHLEQLRGYRDRVRLAMRQRPLTADERKRLLLLHRHVTDEIEGAEKGLEYLEGQYDRLYSELQHRGGNPQVVAGRFKSGLHLQPAEPKDLEAAVQGFEDQWAKKSLIDDELEAVAGADVNERRDELRDGFQHSAPPGYAQRRKRVLGTLRDLREFRANLEHALDHWHRLSDRQRKRLVDLLIQVKEEIRGREQGLDYLEFQIGPGQNPPPARARFEPVERDPKDLEEAIEHLHDQWQDLFSGLQVTSKEKEVVHHEHDAELAAIADRLDHLRDGMRNAPPPGYREAWKHGRADLRDLKEFRENVERALENWKRMKPEQRKRLSGLLDEVDKEMEGRKKGAAYLAREMGGVPFNDTYHGTKAGVRLPFRGRDRKIRKYQRELAEAVEERQHQWTRRTQYIQQRQAEDAEEQEIRALKQARGRSDFEWEQRVNKMRAKLINLGAAPAASGLESIGANGGGGGMPPMRPMSFEQMLQEEEEERRADWEENNARLVAAGRRGDTALVERIRKYRDEVDAQHEEEIESIRDYIRTRDERRGHRPMPPPSPPPESIPEAMFAPAASQLNDDPPQPIGVHGMSGKKSLRLLQRTLKFKLAVREATWDTYTKVMKEAEMAGDDDEAEQLDARRRRVRERQTREIEGLQHQIRAWGFEATSRAELPTTSQLLPSGATVSQLQKKILELQKEQGKAAQKIRDGVALRQDLAQRIRTAQLPSRRRSLKKFYDDAGTEVRRWESEKLRLDKKIKQLHEQLYLRRLRGAAAKMPPPNTAAATADVDASSEIPEPAGVSVRKWWKKRKARKGVKGLAAEEEAEIRREKKRIKTLEREIKQSRKKIQRLRKEERKARRAVRQVESVGISSKVDLTHHLVQAADLVGHPLHAGPNEEAADFHIQQAVDQLHGVMRVPPAEGYVAQLEDWVQGWVDAIRPRQGPTASAALKHLGVSRADSRAILNLRSDRVAEALGAGENTAASRTWRDMHAAALDMLDATAERHRWVAQSDPQAAKERGVGSSGFWSLAARPSNARLRERSRGSVLEADQAEQRHAETVRSLSSEMALHATTAAAIATAGNNGQPRSRPIRYLSPELARKYKREGTMEEAQRLYEEQQRQMAEWAKQGRYMGHKPEFSLELTGSTDTLLRELEAMQPSEYVELEGRRMTVQSAREWLLYQQVAGAKVLPQGPSKATPPFLLRKYAD